MKNIENSYDDLKSFIDRLKMKEEVVGIVEYGGRTYSDMGLGGDYDLTVILDKKISTNFSGVHIHIANIPTDCMILSVDDFLEEEPQNPFYMVHLDCQILYDKNDITKELLERIKRKWMISEELEDWEKHLFRFSFQHILDKLEYRLHKDELFSRYFIYSSFDWYLECYARLHNLKVGQPKSHLAYIKEVDIDLYKLINQLYMSNDLDEQLQLLKQCAKIIIKPIGGLWRKGEILLHLLPGGEYIEEEKDVVVNLLYR